MKAGWRSIALAAFVVVDVALAGLALRPHSPAPVSVVDVTEQATTSGDAATASTDANSTAPTSSPAPAAAAVASLLLDEQDGSLLLTTSTTACGKKSHPFWHDIGSNWVATSLPAPTVLRVKVTGPRSGWVVAADETCRPRFYTTADGGHTWSRGSSTSGAWHLLTSQGKPGLHAPKQDTDAGCPAASPPQMLSAVSATTAVVACGDGTITLTTSAGSSWKTVSRLPALVGLTAGDATSVWALSGDASCLTLAHLANTPGATTTASPTAGCTPAKGARAAAIVADGKELYLTAQDSGTGTLQLWSTHDEGRTWQSDSTPQP